MVKIRKVHLCSVHSELQLLRLRYFGLDITNMPGTAIVRGSKLRGPDFLIKREKNPFQKKLSAYLLAVQLPHRINVSFFCCVFFTL